MTAKHRTKATSSSVAEDATNSKGKFTPGPWLVEWHGFNLTIGTPSTNSNRQHDYVVADTCGNSLVDIANARLIASAPALLDACRSAAEFLDIFEELSEGVFGQWAERRKLIKAAITAAEGR